ncbi:MAG TPA: DUF3488 and transglutaminase-like domain-containing protein, partial [Nitrospiria bacterium]|nr:DUF3488 and transglutaminase-like domain-containing protein [Nitrospiria bacterium]
THLISLTAFATLTLSQSVPLPLLNIGSVTIFASLWGRLRGRSFPIPRRLWNTLTVLFFLFFIADVLWISQSLLDGGIHLLIYLMVQKLFTLKSAKDDLQLHLISFFQLLATADGTTDLVYGLAFVCFLMLTTWALIFYHLKREEEVEGRVIPSDRGSEVVTTPFFFWTNLLTASALVITLLIFFFIPRIGTGFLNSRQGTPRRLSGFSERVQLGSIGPIKLDPTAVMRVTLPQYQGDPSVSISLSTSASPLQFSIYFKGMTFDRYANGAWENTISEMTPVRKVGTRFQIPHDLLIARRGVLLEQEISLEPLDTTILFAVARPLFMEGRISQISIDAGGALHLPNPPRGKISYQAFSLIEPLDPEDEKLTKISYPKEIRDHYLQVEPSPRMEALAGRITGNLKTVYQKVVAVRGFLAGNYRYNLDVPPSRSGHPIEDFLFETKEGYCEHYASAMVLLLRHAGIASRLVSGFLPGEWNPFGKYLLVRQQDAHTWVEVYFPRSGWIIFDPTPPSAGGQPFALVDAYIDWVKTRWDRYIIHYSILDQISLTRLGWSFFGRESSKRINPAYIKMNPRNQRIIGNGALLMIVAAVGLWFYLRRMTGGLFAGGRNATRDAQATVAYRRFLKLMAKKGWKRREGETPMEFARGIAPGDPVNAQARALTALYYRVRFGPPPRDSEKHSQGSIAELRALLKGLEADRQRIPPFSPSTRPGPDRATGESAVRPDGDGP